MGWAKTVRMVAAPSRATVSDDLLSEASSTTLVRATSAQLPPGSIVVGLARLTYAPGARGLRHTSPGPLLLVVEYGALTVSLEGPGQHFRPDQTLAAAGDLALHVGDGLMLPATTAAAFQNRGTLPAVALAVGIFPTTALPREPVPIGLSPGECVWWRDAWSPGAAVQPLGGGWLVDPPSGPVSIALHRLSLRPRGSLTQAAPHAVILAVEAGALTIVAGGRGWLQHPDGPDDGMRPGADVAVLPGDAAVLREMDSITLRNDGRGPLLVLAATVVPTATIVTRPSRSPASAEGFR